MQPLKLVIPGKYWDSQIYSGRLFLFNQNGDIETYDWDKLVSHLSIPASLEIAATAAFLRSDFLYGPDLRKLFHDEEVKEVIRSKFKRLSNLSFVIDKTTLEKVNVDKQESPFPFPHTDSEIYGQRMFVSSRSGLFSATCAKGRTKHPVGKRVEKRWDAPILSIAASYGSIAIAAGSEGLFEHDAFATYKWQDPSQLSTESCNDCNWAFQSIYGSSLIGKGVLAAFNRKDKRTSLEDYDRKLERLVYENELFSLSEGYSWGTQDKIYSAKGGQIQVVKYIPWEFSPEDRIQRFGDISLAGWKGQVIRGGVGLFGAVVECENALVILPSEGTPITIGEEPVNWRVFPRSKHYENHLHVVFEDRIEILSFNHDYLVDQESKKFGLMYINRGRKTA